MVQSVSEFNYSKSYSSSMNQAGVAVLEGEYVRPSKFFVSQLERLLHAKNVYEEEKKLNAVIKDKYTVDEFYDIFTELKSEAKMNRYSGQLNDLLVSYAYMDRMFEYWNRIEKVESVNEDELDMNESGIRKLEEFRSMRLLTDRQYTNFKVLLFNMKGMLLHMTQKYTEALDAFNVAISLDPTYCYAYINQGIVLCYMMKYDEAIRVLSMAITIDISEDLSFFWRAVCYRIKQSYITAIIDAEKSLTLDGSRKSERLYSGLKRTLREHSQDKLDYNDPDARDSGLSFARLSMY